MPNSIPCNDGLRHRALAKAKGDYEAHQVAQCSNAYASWCDDGNTNLAKWAEMRLQMFVDTPLRWKEACDAVSGSSCSPPAKLLLRTMKRAGRDLTKEERRKLRSTCGTPHKNPKSDKLTSCPTDSD